MKPSQPDQINESKPVYYQIAQYTCQYDAKLKSVQCLPFVRTFLETGRTLSEVTPSVNQGGRLPVAEGFKGLTEPLTATVVHIGKA